MLNDRTIYVTLSGIDLDIAVYSSSDGTYNISTLNTLYNTWIIEYIGEVDDVCVCDRVNSPWALLGYRYVFNAVSDAIMFKLQFSDKILVITSTKDSKF